MNYNYDILNDSAYITVNNKVNSSSRTLLVGTKNTVFFHDFPGLDE